MNTTVPQYFPVTVDLYLPKPQPIVNAQQNDSGRGLQITLTGGGNVLTPGNEVINLYAQKPDGTISYLPCTVSGNYILCQFTNQMLAVAGAVQIQLEIVFPGDGGATTTLSTTVCTVNVLTSIIDQDAIESSNEFTALEDALAELAYYRENGLKGDPGQAATVSVGTVTASDPGSNPQITNSGTENAAVLNFVLPRGEQGPQGPPGQGVVFGAYSSFPNPGETNILYVDNTINPALAYVWNGSAYIPAGGGGTAEDVTYDNSTSGLTATNVQGAIDENAAAISELKTSNLNVDITPASDVSQVYEYFRYSVIGNICIVDVGGIVFGSSGSGKSAADSGLPVAKTRPVGILTTDPGATNQPGSTTTIYGSIGGDNLSVQVPPGMEGKYLYGQIIYII